MKTRKKAKSFKSRKKAKMFHSLQAAIVQCVASSQQSLQEISTVANMASIVAAQETEAIQSVVVLSVEGLAATQIRKHKSRLKKVKKRKKKKNEADVDSEDTCLDDSVSNPLHIRREDLAKLDENREELEDKAREGCAMQREDAREIKRKETEEHKVDLSSSDSDIDDRTYDEWKTPEEHRRTYAEWQEEEKGRNRNRAV